FGGASVNGSEQVEVEGFVIEVNQGAGTVHLKSGRFKQQVISAHHPVTDGNTAGKSIELCIFAAHDLAGTTLADHGFQLTQYRAHIDAVKPAISQRHLT